MCCIKSLGTLRMMGGKDGGREGGEGCIDC